MDVGFFTLVLTFFLIIFYSRIVDSEFCCMFTPTNKQTTKNTTIMKTTIFAKTKTNGLGIENGNAVSVELNRYAKGHWPVSLTGFTHEYELIVNGKVAFTFRMSLSDAKLYASDVLMKEWICANPW